MSRLIGKDPDAGKDWRQKKRVAEDEHNRLNGHEFEQTLGDSETEETGVLQSMGDHKESDVTYQLKNNCVPHRFEKVHWLLDSWDLILDGIF